MVPPTGLPRAIEVAPHVFEPRAIPVGSRPVRVPTMTTIVLFLVVSALLAFIAWP